MTTALVFNSGIIGNASRIAQQRTGVWFTPEQIDPIAGSTAVRPVEQHPRDIGTSNQFASMSRRRQEGHFQDQVISLGGVLVSPEVGRVILQAQAFAAANVNTPLPVEAEKNVATYEFNQSLLWPLQAAAPSRLGQ